MAQQLAFTNEVMKSITNSLIAFSFYGLPWNVMNILQQFLHMLSREIQRSKSVSIKPYENKTQRDFGHIPSIGKNAKANDVNLNRQIPCSPKRTHPLNNTKSTGSTWPKLPSCAPPIIYCYKVFFFSDFPLVKLGNEEWGCSFDSTGSNMGYEIDVKHAYFHHVTCIANNGLIIWLEREIDRSIDTCTMRFIESIGYCEHSIHMIYIYGVCT